MKIKELFTDASKWTKGAFARDIRGLDVPSYGDSGVCFCLMGALNYCYKDRQKEKHIVFEKLRDRIPNHSIIRWNDAPERTFEEVKALVERLDI